jgi:citrate lyase beta subunit
VIFCTEDAIGAGELPWALDQLEAALASFVPTPLLRFVRVRNPATLRRVVQMAGVQQLTGFVLPKVTRHNLNEYLAVLPPNNNYQLMLTLETAEVFDCAEMAALRTLLLDHRIRPHVLTLRIGGNDLLQLLGLRRPRRRSIYATPLGTVIGQLVTTFRPHGFNLTGPVFEYLDRPADLARETRQDLAHGLFGKSAIHPDQVPMIEAEYRVSAGDLHAAEKILADGAPPVFRLHDAMCEPATHHVWARSIVERASLYGVRNKAPIARPKVWPGR